MSNDSKADCSRCNRNGESFRCMKRRYIFDVDKARKYVNDGREALELDRDDVEYSVKKCDINANHVLHVDPSIPGIVSHIFVPDKDGRIVRATRLIDGHHRASRCLQLGIPFRVHVLSEKESAKILLKAPTQVCRMLEKTMNLSSVGKVSKQRDVGRQKSEKP